MKILIAMKQDLNQAIEKFSNKEIDISRQNARDIADFKKIIEKADSPSVLRTTLEKHLNKMKSKYFSFWRNDLKREITAVLKQEKYTMSFLLVEEYKLVRAENSKLSMVIEEKLAEANALITQLKLEKQQLAEALAAEKTAHAQTDKIGKLQITQLTAVMANLETEKVELAKQLEESEQGKAALYSENIKYLNEIARLKQALQELTTEEAKSGENYNNTKELISDKKYYMFYG